MNEDEAQVIDFKDAAAKVRQDDAPPLEFRRQDFRDCRHNKRRINGTLRRVECRLCNEILDPVQVLIEISGELGEWQVVQLKQRVRDLEYIEHLINREGKVQLMTPEEKQMTPAQLIEHHSKTGHPPDKIKLTPRNMECYCGLTLGRVAYRDIEAQVLEAVNKQRRKLKMNTLPPVKG